MNQPSEKPDLRKTLKPGQTVKIEIVSTPKARHSRMALNSIFRRSPEVAGRWSEDSGAARIRESVREHRKFLGRRRPHNEQRYQLKVGAACVIPNINTTHIDDLQSVARDVKVTVVKDAAPRPATVVGFSK